MPNSSSNLRQIVNNYFENLNKHDISKCLLLLHEDCFFSFTGAGTANGKAQIQKFLVGTLWKQFPSLTLTVRVYTELLTNAAVEGVMQGRTSTNKSFNDIGFMQVFDFVDKKIVRIAVYMDTPSIRAQIGRW